MTHANFTIPIVLTIVILLDTSHPLDLVEAAVEDCLRDVVVVVVVHPDNNIQVDEEWVIRHLPLDGAILADGASLLLPDVA